MQTTSDHGNGDHPDDRPDSKTVDITVNNTTVTVDAQTTGSAIKAAAGVDPAWDLFIIRGDHEIPVGNTEQIHVHPGERFVATPSLDPS